MSHPLDWRERWCTRVDHCESRLPSCPKNSWCVGQDRSPWSNSRRLELKTSLGTRILGCLRRGESEILVAEGVEWPCSLVSAIRLCIGSSRTRRSEDPPTSGSLLTASMADCSRGQRSEPGVGSWVASMSPVRRWHSRDRERPFLIAIRLDLLFLHVLFHVVEHHFCGPKLSFCASVFFFNPFLLKDAPGGNWN